MGPGTEPAQGGPRKKRCLDAQARWQWVLRVSGNHAAGTLEPTPRASRDVAEQAERRKDSQPPHRGSSATCKHPGAGPGCGSLCPFPHLTSGPVIPATSLPGRLWG